MNKLPVSIISPVRNCIGEMPAHAEHLRGLSRVAREIIIVDSDSSDGTMEFLKDALGSIDAVFLNHPPGLYPSWNHGISHASQPYLTVATVGDPLPPASLEKLHHTLESNSADVVISAPVLLNPDGSRSTSQWPIHQLIEACGLAEPRAVSQATWLALTLGFFPKSPLASSAGNLYRTAVFQNNLFPTHCGHRGDVIWAITSARKARWMIDPTVESCFKFNSPSPGRLTPDGTIISEWSKVVMRAYDEEYSFMRSAGVPDWYLTELRCMLESGIRSLSNTSAYAAVRKSILPWFLNPEAIRLRSQRKRLKNQGAGYRDLLTRFMRSLDSSGTEAL